MRARGRLKRADKGRGSHSHSRSRSGVREATAQSHSERVCSVGVLVCVCMVTGVDFYLNLCECTVAAWRMVATRRPAINLLVLGRFLHVRWP